MTALYWRILAEGRRQVMTSRLIVLGVMTALIWLATLIPLLWYVAKYKTNGG